MTNGFQIKLDGSVWSTFDNREEAIEYADWLVKMPWHAPEAKGNSVEVIDNTDGAVIFKGERTDFRPRFAANTP